MDVEWPIMVSLIFIVKTPCFDWTHQLRIYSELSMRVVGASVSQHMRAVPSAPTSWKEAKVEMAAPVVSSVLGISALMKVVSSFL